MPLQEGELDCGVARERCLLRRPLPRDRALWSAAIEEVLARGLPDELKAEALVRIAVTRTAEKLLPQYESSRVRGLC